ncbi:conserved hypothetical protein [methanotrophic bacterial endosymbiont of Bathymodiolus sp.]|nr:conserved hypothetical protein [methanotrophic bacterial endosymbiont of Bathymodiolus sp.]
MGVFPRLMLYQPVLRRLPHARGGVSTALVTDMSFMLSSPRPWGCFRLEYVGYSDSEVFPTPVGVFPDASSPTLYLVGLPHARGGVSFLSA